MRATFEHSLRDDVREIQSVRRLYRWLPPVPGDVTKAPVVECVKGNCASGMCELSFAKTYRQGSPGSFTSGDKPKYHGALLINWKGQCKSNLPHGKGDLYTSDANLREFEVKGAMMEHGRLEGALEIVFAKHEFIGRMTGEFRQGKPVGVWSRWSKEGKLFQSDHFKDGKFLRTEFFASTGKAISAEDSDDFLERVLDDKGSFADQYRFHTTIEIDRAFILIENPSAREMNSQHEALQKALTKLVGQRKTDPKTGVAYYEPETVARLRLLEELAVHRRLAMGIPHTSGTMFTSRPYLMECLSVAGRIRVPAEAERANVTRTLEVLGESKIPRVVLPNIQIFVTPFQCPGASLGFVPPKKAHGYESVVLMGNGRALIMHEVGHAVGQLIGLPDETYWPMRKVAPVTHGPNPFDDSKETFAEDFRVLFGGPSSTYRHAGRWKPRYGDLRDFPAQRARVAALIESRLVKWQPVRPEELARREPKAGGKRCVRQQRRCSRNCLGTMSCRTECLRWYRPPAGVE